MGRGSGQVPGMARVTALVDIRFIRFSYFVCLLIKVSDDFKSVIGKSKARDLKVLQELSFITDAEAMTACCSVWVGF